MKKRIAALWRAHGLPILAATVLICFTGLFFWRIAAGYAAAATLQDLTGDRAALRAFPLSFDLRDERHLRTVSLRDGAPSTDTVLTDPLYATEYISRPLSVTIPGRRDKVGEFRMETAARGAETGIYLYLNFYSRGNAWYSGAMAGAGVFTGLYTGKPYKPDDFPTFNPSVHSAFIGSTLYYILDNSDPALGYQGENGLFRLALDPDTFRPDSADPYRGYVEQPLEYGDADCIASVGSGTPVLGLAAAGEYLVLLTRSRDGVTLMLLDQDGNACGSYEAPLQGGRVSYTLCTDTSQGQAVCAVHLAGYDAGEPLMTNMLDARFLALRIGADGFTPLLSAPASAMRADGLPLDSVYYLAWRDGKLLVSGLRQVAPDTTYATYEGSPIAVGFFDVYVAVYEPSGMGSAALLYAGQFDSGMADDNKTQIHSGVYYAGVPPYRTQFYMLQNYRMEGDAA